MEIVYRKIERRGKREREREREIEAEVEKMSILEMTVLILLIISIHRQGHQNIIIACRKVHTRGQGFLEKTALSSISFQ